LFLMCDVSDLGSFAEPESPICDGQPLVMIYDQIPAGIGLSENLYSQHETIMRQCYDLVAGCSCEDGCPGCVGPSGPNGIGGKLETLALLELLLAKSGNLLNG
jgi:DEAD/DEAH box helicase domain-containing protein